MTPTDIAAPIIRQLQDAWNAADGATFAAPFTDDASFVNIRGELHTGPAIGPGHQAIFDTIYKGSSNRYDVVAARRLDDHVILVHVEAELRVPEGPLAGIHNALASVVLVGDGDDHRIAAFHNTIVAPG